MAPNPEEQLMWVEKYRPFKLEDIINQKEIVERLEAIVRRPSEMPHMLFAGPPGTGKTTAALCVAREIMKEYWRDYTLELNASNERGIDTVRTRIKNFASYADRRADIPFRLVILDESDAMCLDPSTKVIVGKLEKDGLEEKTLEQLYEAHGEGFFALPTYNSNTRFPEDDVGRIVPSGSTELFCIEFEDGRQIFASSEHPFFHIEGNRVSVIRTRDIIPGETELADFSGRFLHCHNCRKVFYRANTWDHYERAFCSAQCRNVFFGSLSKWRTKEEKLAIAAKSIQSFKARGIYSSLAHRTKRSGIAKRLLKEGKIGAFTLRQYNGGRGAWLGKSLSEEHKKAISSGVRKRLEEDPEIRKRISQRLTIALNKEGSKYRELVASGFFKENNYKAWLASQEYWKKNRFRSKLEQKVASLLDSWKIGYEREHVILRNDEDHPYSLVIDFVINKRIALFVNGCWWHVCPECRVAPLYEKQLRNMEKDNRHAQELMKLGYKVVVVWEHELIDEKSVKTKVLPKLFETVGISGMRLPVVKHSRVISVTSMGTKPVLNISVVANKNFFLANGILTHNTNDAQTALRRIMEESSRAARFILTANYSSNIIEPIQSRCAVFRFSRLTEADVIAYLEGICKREGIKYQKAALGIIYKATEGDMRHALNMLQAASTMGEIGSDSVNKVTGISGRAKVEEVIGIALEGDFSTARSKMIELLQVGGMSEHDFIKFANDTISKSPSFSSSIEAIEATAEADYRLLVGANPDIQLSAYLAQLAKIGKKMERGTQK